MREMKKSPIVVIILLLFSMVAEARLAVSAVQAGDREVDVQLIDEKNLKITYSHEKDNEMNRWLIKFNRQSEKEGVQQRLKIRMTDQDDQVIEYPAIENTVEKAGWVLEKEFSGSMDGQFSFKLSQSIKKLHLYIQMDQKEEAITENAKEKISENILNCKKAFILDSEKLNGKAKYVNTSSNEKIKKATDNAEKAFGPSQEASPMDKSITSFASYRPIYTNKTPEYEDNTIGKYPTHSWQPEGQANVINHQGGFAEASGWDGVNSWDIAMDDHTKSYIKYGEDASNPNISIRKFAQQTDKPDEFNITLNIKGNTSYKPGVDMVFLLDNSGSMNNNGGSSTQSRKRNTGTAFKKIIDELQDLYPNNQGGIRIGSHIFSDYVKGAWGTDPGEKMSYTLSTSHADWDSMVAEYNRALSLGQTFTQRGLREAGDLLKDAPNIGQRYKLLFVLTDGSPNRSWRPISTSADLSMYYDPYYVTNSEMGTKGSYNGASNFRTGNTTKFSSTYSGVLNSHITTTNSIAKDLKEKEGIEIHTIAVNIEGSSGDHSTDVLKKGLYRMSTKKANTGTSDTSSDYFYYDVSNPDELTEVFKSWYDTVIRTVDKGILTDPLGEMVDIVEKTTPEETVKVSQVNNGAKAIDHSNMPTSQLKDEKRTIETSNINLTGGQEIEINYTVKLKTTVPTFVSNHWYPTNKTTILQPTPERTNDLIEFGSPSVKVQKDDFVIPVEKVWVDNHQSEAEDEFKLRPEKITVKLQRQKETEWEDIETLDLDSEHQWKGHFSPVEGGEEKSYRVIEPYRTIGYKHPQVNQASFNSETMSAEGIKITNELLRGDYTFKKFMGDGTTKFDKDMPKFKVLRGDKLIAENLMPDRMTGKVTIKDLPIGDYTIEETDVPEGFQKMPNFTINVTENDPPTSLMFKVEGKTEEYSARNHLKDFTAKIEKNDEYGKLLAGASFELKGPNNYEKMGINGPIFEFTKLRPGKYTLIETESPNGYVRIDELINFEIKEDGTVAVSPHPNVTGSGGINGGENTIELKVSNKKVRAGVLPSTGASGIHALFLIAGVFIVSGTFLILRLYFNRRKI